MADLRYNVQCLHGHVYCAPPDSELKKRCIEWGVQGHLDALSLSLMNATVAWRIVESSCVGKFAFATKSVAR